MNLDNPDFRNVITDLSERRRDGLVTPYWQRWFKDLFAVLTRPLTVTTVTAAQSIGKASSLLLVDASAGPVLLTLPTAKDGYGIPLNVKKIDATANAVVIQPLGGELIDGALNLAINTQYTSRSFVSSGSAWWVIQ